MKALSLTASLVFCFAANAVTQDIQLTGTVTNLTGGAALQNVVVSLKNHPGSRDTTGADGKYSITGTTGVLTSTPETSISGTSQLQGHFLQFSTLGVEPVTVDIFTASGARISSIFKNILLAPGMHCIDLSHENTAPGLYLVRYHQGGISSVFSYASVDSRQSPHMPVNGNHASSSGAFKRSAAVLDTLLFTATGFTTARVAVTSYSGQNDIALQSNAFWVYDNGKFNWAGDWSGITMSYAFTGTPTLSGGAACIEMPKPAAALFRGAGVVH